jgi:hypothetical protein
MLLLGQTFLKSTLDGIAFLVYWLICFLFTFAAIVIALRDLRLVRHRARQERQRLFEESLGKIEQVQDQHQNHGLHPKR